MKYVASGPMGSVGGMRYRRLGRWGVQVSEISLGSWLTFGGSVDEERAVACVRWAFELGVNFFDTANVYSSGRAEEVMGRALHDFPREEFVLGTKAFFPMSDRPNASGLSRKHVIEQCHASLRRLGVDYVDIYQCHRFDPDTPLDETCRAMDDLIRGGKTVYWGVSEWTPEQMRAAVELCEREGLHPPASDQPRYSLLDRGIETRVLPTCAELGLGVLAFSPLGQGVLTGKYHSPDEVPGDSRAADPTAGRFMSRLLTRRNVERVNRLRPIADELECTVGQLALAWALRRPELSSVIVGATKPSHVNENVAASGLELEGAVLERIDAALGELRPRA